MFSSLKIIICFIFFIQIVTAIQIFRKRRSHSSHSTNNPPVIIILNQATAASQKAMRTDIVSTLPNQAIQRAISTHNQFSKQSGSKRIHKGIILGSIFLITFLLINQILRPFTYAWVPLLLPVLLVLPFLVFPSYREMKTLTTLLTLIFGIGLGGFGLFLVL